MPTPELPGVNLQEEFEAFRATLVDNVVAAIETRLPAHAEEDLYLLEFVTDGDPVSIWAAASTEEMLARISDKYPDYDVEQFRWWLAHESDESDLEDGTSPLLFAIASKVSDAIKELDIEDEDEEEQLQAEYQRLAFDTITDALADPRILAAVQAVNPKWNPVLSVADSDPDKKALARQAAIVRRLNPDNPMADRLLKVLEI